MQKAWLSNCGAIIAAGLGGALLLAAQEIRGIQNLAAETLQLKAEASEVIACHAKRDCLKFSVVLRDSPTVLTERAAWYDLLLSGVKPETTGVQGFYFSQRDGEMVAFPETYIARLPSPGVLYGVGGVLVLSALLGVTIASKRRER